MQSSALFLKDIGKTFYLSKEDRELSPPAPNDVTVELHAAGINPVDAKLAISGHPKWEMPYICGLDGAGVVTAVGADVTRLAVGDAVAWHGNLIQGGAFAEHCNVPEHVLFPIPPLMPAAVAASVPCAGLTAWLTLKARMKLKRGMSILIEAGAGGVGSFAIQIANSMGLHIISTASPVNHAYVASLGAHHVINHSHPLREQKILAANDGHKLDAVFDSIGYNTSARNIQLLKHEGQYASLLGVPQIDSDDAFTASPAIFVIALGGAYLAKDHQAQCRLAQMGSDMLTAITQNVITPVPITYVAYSDTDVTKAMHRQLEGHTRGKQVIVIA